MELLFDDGTTYPLDGDYVIGRDPGAMAGATRAIQLTHNAGGISRMHVSITVREGQVSVADLWSANGTFLEIPGLAGLVRLKPGEPQDLLFGTRIKLLKRWCLRV